MQILAFLIQLSGATFLLLFAVRMVRTGIERAYGARFRGLVTGTTGAPRLVPAGILLAILLQSSAAVAILAAGFAGSGTLAFLPGVALVLGGDLGSALIIQVLSLNLGWLAPVLLTVGGYLFLKSDSRRLRQTGRIVLGMAFILISLRFLRETVDPIRGSALLPALEAWFERDFVTAFLAGALLAFLMHSSVAAILMCVTFVGIGALPVSVGVSLVLGANLGSAVIPLWHSRTMPPAARRIPAANLALRGTAAVMFLLAVNLLPVPPLATGAPPGQRLVLAHIGFNAVVVFTLFLAPFLEAPLRRLIPDAPPPPQDSARLHRSALDRAALASPARSLACLRSEVLRMAEVLAAMLGPLIGLYTAHDRNFSRAIADEDDILNAALDGIRHFSAAMPHSEMTKPQMKEMRALVDYAIALEAAGDVIVKRLLPLAAEKSDRGLRFSQAGAAELAHIHETVVATLATAITVLVSDDVEGARLLLEDKAEMGRLERASRKNHLKRLSAGEKESLASSDIHLETAYLLKEVNSWVVTVAHPILVREGQLLETRLIRDISPEAGA